MEKEIINTALIKLEEIIGKETVKAKQLPDSAHFDYKVTIKDVVFLCDVKAKITISNYDFIQQDLNEAKLIKSEHILLIAQTIPTVLVDKFAKNGINTLDLAGNCRITTKEFIINIEGKKITEKSFIAYSNTSRLFHEVGLKIIFKLLENPDIVNRSYRQIRNFTNVSLGSVAIIINELIESGYILETKNGKSLKNKKELMKRWIFGYVEILKPKFYVGQMTFRDSKIKKEWYKITLPENSNWGGEPAANLHDGYLYPEQFIIYGGSIGQLVKAGLRPDENGEILVYDKFYKSNDSEILTPILLIYADLISSGNSRNIDAAQKILDNELQYLK